jgi:ubiquinone/menaquinone biosynthesis C-methylase UbiE
LWGANQNPRYRYDPARSIVWKEICRYLQKYVPEEAHILDLGAGCGDFLRHIFAAQKYGLEINRDFLKFWPDNVHPLIQSASDPFPLGDAALDMVFASNFFEHFVLEECSKILAEVCRVLRSNGRLMILQPNFRLQPGRYYDDYTHRTPFTEVSFADFLESLGWSIRRCESRFLPLTLRSRLPKAWWLVHLYLYLPFRPFAGQFLLIAEKRDE